MTEVEELKLRLGNAERSLDAVILALTLIADELGSEEAERVERRLREAGVLPAQDVEAPMLRLTGADTVLSIAVGLRQPQAQFGVQVWALGQQSPSQSEEKGPAPHRNQRSRPENCGVGRQLYRC